MDSKEFKEWKVWYEQVSPEEFSMFNDKILYDIYKTNVDNLTRDDIKYVFNHVCVKIGDVMTESEIIWVLSQYASEVKQDPTATWNLIVENLIYQLPRFKEIKI